MSSSNKPVLGYWDIRGLGQPIRLLLTYAGVDFEDRLYPLAENEGASWFEEKPNLGLAFPNLPYYFDGDLKLTQSLAILRYIARKYKLDGTTDQEKVDISLVEQQVYDLLMAFGRVAYDPNCDKLKPDYLAALPNQLKLLSDFLGAKPFVAGSSISYVDFLLYEYLLKISVLVPEVFGKFENLQKFIVRIESLPKVSAYIKQAKPMLFNGTMAKWNATK